MCVHAPTCKGRHHQLCDKGHIIVLLLWLPSIICIKTCTMDMFFLF